MRAYSAGYTRRWQHFVIQNLPARKESSRWDSLFKVALNLLQRGAPTPLPSSLRAHWGVPSTMLDGDGVWDVVPDTFPQWFQTIRGHEDGTYNPASEFFHHILPDALGQDQHLMWLIRPEVRFEEILQTVEPGLVDQQVDFYCQAARLVIEIHGDQHRTDSAQAARDRLRERTLTKKGIAVYSIWTTELRNPQWKDTEPALSLVAAIRKAGAQRRAVREDSSESDLNRSLEATLQTVAAFRLQVVVLELLLSGQLTMEQEAWRLGLQTDLGLQFARVAVEDLRSLLTDLGALAGINAAPPDAFLAAADSAHAERPDVMIDLSVRRRWTDENLAAPDVIFVRTDYIDEYPDRKGRWVPVDHFRVESGEPIRFHLKQQDEAVAQRLLSRLFRHSTFKAGQWPILANVLERRKTVGVLPTGQGKSLCYQLPALLQPGVTVVVSPLKSLMRDQLKELENIGITRVVAINSDDSAPERQAKMSGFAAGRYQIALMSPERFQVQTFREACRSVAERRRVLHAVVDEVHCLSEWGHDFRLSYLNLARTLERLFPDAIFLGLTATASSNALHDIQHEFLVSDQDVIYRLDIKRENLRFQVVPSKRRHIDEIASWIKRRYEEGDDEVPCGIVFTPHVNGERGCFEASHTLAAALNTSVRTFSGKQANKDTMTNAGFEAAKQAAQDDFKAGTVRLLCATKAFGMGVNKPDVRFTIHLGVPASMEALYQEAGRAGRDGRAADCLVFAELPSRNDLAAVTAPGLRPTEFQKLAAKQRGDLYVQLFLLSQTVRAYRDEYDLIRKVRQSLETAKAKGVLLTAESFECSADQLERAIYRLSQLGYVEDWTVEDFLNGHYRVEWTAISDEDAEANLLRLARAYSGQMEALTLESICEDDPEVAKVIFGKPDRPRRDVLILTLLHWCHEHFNYNRRQSLKSVFELCAAYESLGPESFRTGLEAFFAVTRTTVKLQELTDLGLDGIHHWRGLFQLPQNSEGKIWSWAERNKALLPLKAMLARLLESYQSNVALDMVSAMTRLLLDEYADPDGTGRLRAQLGRPQWSERERDLLIQFALDIGRHADRQQRRLLSRDLLSMFAGRAMAIRVHEALQDEESARIYAEELARTTAAAVERIERGLAGG